MIFNRKKKILISIWLSKLISEVLSSPMSDEWNGSAIEKIKRSREELGTCASKYSILEETAVVWVRSTFLLASCLFQSYPYLKRNSLHDKWHRLHKMAIWRCNITHPPFGSKATGFMDAFDLLNIVFGKLPRCGRSCSPCFRATAVNSENLIHSWKYM